MPELTPEEQAHERSLEALIEDMRRSSADPATSIAIRQMLGVKIAALEDQMDDVEAGVFSRDTVDINAAEEQLAPALGLLKDLKAELAEVSTQIKYFATIAAAVDTAISTGESLLG